MAIFNSYVSLPEGTFCKQSEMWKCLEIGLNLMAEWSIIIFHITIATKSHSEPTTPNDIPIAIGSKPHLQLAHPQNSQVFVSHHHFITRCVWLNPIKPRLMTLNHHAFS